MVISCRSEYIGADYRDRFQPVDRNQSSKGASLQEAVIMPFSSKQVHNYIDQYVGVYQPLWKAQEYKDAIDRIPSLNELVGNPFLMTLLLEVLPRMMDPGQDMSGTRVTRVLLYDQFIEQWLERGKRRLGEKNLSLNARAAFDSLSEEGFTINGIDYLKKLSAAIYKEQDGQPVVEYSRFQDEGSWKATFFGREDDKYLLREACPLVRNGNQYRFIHRSMLEYGVSRAIFDPQEWKEKATSQSTMNRRGSMSSVFSFEIQDDIESAESESEKEPDSNSPLVWRSFVNEVSLLQFLKERVQQEPIFKRQLLEFIEYSKKDKKWRTAAANAITILIKAGVEFRFADMKGVRIPGADLSNGVFELANLQGADLRKVNLRNISLRRADLSEADMKGVQFGELPFLQYKSMVHSCMYSPDGSSFATGLGTGNIEVYETSNWDQAWTLYGHDEKIFCLAYSPNSDRIVSGSKDGTARLWDLTIGECLHTFTGHSQWVMCVAYSPQEDVVASGSEDCTIRLWDVETGGCRHVLSGHTSVIKRIAFSPDGNKIASLGDDTVRLWDVATGSCRYTLKDYYPYIITVVYSPQGNLIASASGYQSVMIWDEETGKCRYDLAGHSRNVSCLVFSPKGNQLASGSEDKSLRLWDVELGTCSHTLVGHTNVIRSVAYSPLGDLLASSSDDGTVRLWDVENGECRHTLSGHSGGVSRVLYPPKFGGFIATSGIDNTVRLWDVGAGTSRIVPSNHKDEVLSVRYSPKRDQIASCSKDRTIRLWDMKTGTCVRTMTGHLDEIQNVVYSPQEDLLASYDKDSTVRIWDVESGVCRHLLAGHSQMISSVAFSPQGTQVVTGSRDMTGRLWDVETGSCQHVLTGHSETCGYVNAVAYLPPGNQAITFSTDNSIKFWDVTSGTCVQTLTSSIGGIHRFMLLPDGNRIVTTSSYSMELWDVQSGECSKVLKGHEHFVYMACAPQGNQIATTSLDGTFKQWDLETGECRRTLKGSSGGQLTYSPNGRFILYARDLEGKRAKSCLRDAETGESFWELDERFAGIAWINSETVDAFVTGDRYGSVKVWDVLDGGDRRRRRVRLRWTSTNGRLVVKDTCIQGVKGLSHFNKQLMEQRGAANEPVLY